MKKTLLLPVAFAMCTYFSAGAQEIETTSTCTCDPCECTDCDCATDTTNTVEFEDFENMVFEDYEEYDDYENFSLTKSKRGFKGHFEGFSIGYTRLVSSLGNWDLPAGYQDMSQKWNSFAVSMNVVDFSIPFTSGFGLVTGAGVEMNNFKFKKEIGLQKVNGITQVDYNYINNGIDLKKSKLTTYYLNVPLLLEGQFGSRNQFWVNGGIIGGVRFGSYTKIVSDDQPIQGKLKHTGNISTRNFHYGYHLGLGMKHIGFTATYYPGGVFKPGTGPDVEQFSIGLIFMRK